MRTVEDSRRFALPMLAGRPALIFSRADWRAGGQLIHPWARENVLQVAGNKMWSFDCIPQIALGRMRCKYSGEEEEEVVVIPLR